MRAYTSPIRFLGGNRRIFWCLGVVVAAVIVLTGFLYNRHEIRISADGKQINIVMRGGTVANAIKKAKVPLGEKDIVEPPLQTRLADDLQISIKRMVSVTLVADGVSQQHWVSAGMTVEQTLQRLNVALNSGDQVVPGKIKRISSGDTIEVIRFSERFLDQSLKIPFRIERRDDNSMERGQMRVVRQGAEGLIQKTVKITLQNGQEVKRETVGEKVLRQPVNKIVAVGTVRTKVVSRGGTLRFSKALTMGSSAYTHTGNNTAAGVYPRRGTVAVDPDVIPLGTRLYVDGYGYATAQDIGSAIQGNRIDLFFETEKECRKWGRRSVKVYILQ